MNTPTPQPQSQVSKFTRWLCLGLAVSLGSVASPHQPARAQVTSPPPSTEQPRVDPIDITPPLEQVDPSRLINQQVEPILPRVDPIQPLPFVLPLDRRPNLELGQPLRQSPAWVPLAILRNVLPEPGLLQIPPDRQFTLTQTASGLGGAGAQPSILQIDPNIFTTPGPRVVLRPGVGTVNPGVGPDDLATPSDSTTLFLLIDPTEPNAPELEGGGSSVQPITVLPDLPNVGVQADSRTLAIAGLEDCQQQVQQLQQIEAQALDQSPYLGLIRCYEQNLSMARQQQHSPWTLYALNNLAIVHYVLGEYAQAIEQHQQQLAIAKAAGNRSAEGMALAGLGAAHGALGNYATAIDYYTQSLALLSAETAPQWRALALRNLGNAYLAQADYGRAAQYQQQSLGLTQQIGDRYGEAQSLGNLGNTYTALGDTDQALAFHQQGLAVVRQLGDRLQEAQALMGLGTTHAYRREYTQAVDYYQQSLTLIRSLQARLGEGITLTNLGEALLRLGRLAEAERQLFQGIEVWESLRAGLGTHDGFKVSIFETQAATYRNLQEVLAAQNKATTALEIAERGRARAFVELLARNMGTSNPPEAGLNTATDRSLDAPPDLAAIRQTAIAHNTTIVEYTLLRSQVAPVPHGASVQSNRPQESMLLVWVVKPTGEVVLRQVDLSAQGQPLEHLVTSSRTALGVGGRSIEVSLTPSPAPRNQPRALQQLHQILIEPIADLLPTDPAARVTIVPQEALFLVPFPALQDPTGQYLIQRHTLLSAPSIQVMALTHRMSQRLSSPHQAPVGSTLLIVGNPTMPTLPTAAPGSTPALSPLPGAEAEAIAIAQLFNTQPLLGNQATETTVVQQMPQADVIHLATHGLLEGFEASRNGLGVPGAIALAPNGAADGFLTSQEISNLSLKADLVVLSACDTGRGRITEDGVIGLSRSLIGAGAPSVVVSLWAVSDDATADLMLDFYQQLQHSPDKAQALRQAMLTTMQQHPHPRAWSGFTLVGNP